MNTWQPINTAPRNNKCPLYLARFDQDGKIAELDYDGIWEYWQESWEMPHINGWDWCSARGIYEPTHWAYQYEEGAPPAFVPLLSDDKMDTERAEGLLKAFQNSFLTPAEAVAHAYNMGYNRGRTDPL
jgi:hypothetical protein